MLLHLIELNAPAFFQDIKAQEWIAGYMRLKNPLRMTSPIAREHHLLMHVALDLI